MIALAAIAAAGLIAWVEWWRRTHRFEERLRAWLAEQRRGSPR